MTIAHAIRGPLLNPRNDGSVQFFPDAALIGDERGKIIAVEHWNDVVAQYPNAQNRARIADGWILPPMLDAHIHIPQHPIRGRFLEGITGSPPDGPLLAGLERNVFPAEGHPPIRQSLDPLSKTSARTRWHMASSAARPI